MAYTWEGFFEELLTKICSKYDSRSLATLAHKIFQNSPLKDQFKDGTSGPLTEIDPLTFIAYFNRGQTNERRIGYCKAIKDELSLEAPIPSDFQGIPVINNQSSWFFPYEKERSEGVFQKLWKFSRALEKNELDNTTFSDVLAIKGVGLAKLTQLCFICRPQYFLPLDRNTTGLLSSKNLLKNSEKWRDELSFQEYEGLLKSVKTTFPGLSFSQISASAYETEKQYWWLNCNPKMWDPRGREIGSLQTYTTHNEEGNERRIYKHFKAVKPGDLLVGYITSPAQEVATLFEITKGIHTDSSGKEAIEFKKIKDYEPITREQLESEPTLAKCDPLISNQGSLFALKEDEFNLIDNFVERQGMSDDLEVQHWLIAPGENARMWEDCLKNSVISIGWDEMGDLSRFATSDALKTKYLEIFKPENNPVMRVKGLYEFTHSMKKGDLVFAKQGLSKVIGYGRITSDYIFDESRPEHKNVRKVEWIKTGEWILPPDDRVNGKTLTNLNKYPEFVARLMARIDGKGVTSSQSDPYTIEDALKELFISKEDFVPMVEGLAFKKNIVLQGPPGVGKTFAAKRLAYSLIGRNDDSRIGFVQFHPSYSYEDFVQGIRPVEEGFRVQDGLFLEFCKTASESPLPFVVIIDEINRGNLSKIFGELLMLIESDKRQEKVRLTYSQNGHNFSVPDNLHIIGTMNTADRSLSLIDYALRRRFLFFTLKPELDSPMFVEHLSKLGLRAEEIKKVQGKIGKLNEIIKNDRRTLGAGFEIGHSYFSKKPEHVSFEQWFGSIMQLEIEPLLKEYWFDDIEKVSEATKMLKAA